MNGHLLGSDFTTPLDKNSCNIYANSLYFSLATSTDNRISDLQRDELQNLSGSLKSLGTVHI